MPDPVGRDLLIVRQESGVGVITLNDPARRNAVSAELSLAVAASVHELTAAGCGAIVVTAKRPVFSAGGALEDLLEDPVPLADMYEGFIALAQAPVPTLAVVDGPAVGAGVNFALSCDVVIATPRAVFDPCFLDVGIHPGGAHLWRMERRIGRQATASLVLLGEKLSGEQAAARGLAWACVASDDAEETAMAMARRAAERDHELVSRAKATMRAGDAITDPMDALRIEREAQQWAISRPEFGDRIARIRERVANGSRR